MKTFTYLLFDLNKELICRFLSITNFCINSPARHIQSGNFTIDVADVQEYNNSKRNSRQQQFLNFLQYKNVGLP